MPLLQLAESGKPQDAQDSRPAIPISAIEVGRDEFIPSPDWAAWIARTFIYRDGPLHNPDHQHLEFAHIGLLWTNASNRRHMRIVLGEAEIPNPRGSQWQIARQKYQLEQWFQSYPDFVITLSGEHLSRANDRTLLAVIEHELYHCAQRLDEFGSPKFHRDGSPVFGIKGHDIEEFIGVAARWGLREDLKLLLEQASQEPHVPDELIANICGTCHRKAA